MKETLTKLFWPVLRPFEKGDGPYNYRPTNRKVLLGLGVLFSLLAAVVLVVGFSSGGLAFLLPVLVFGGVGFVALVVGSLGSDRAVCAIWGNK